MDQPQNPPAKPNPRCPLCRKSNGKCSADCTYGSLFPAENDHKFVILQHVFGHTNVRQFLRKYSNYMDELVDKATNLFDDEMLKQFSDLADEHLNNYNALKKQFESRQSALYKSCLKGILFEKAKQASSPASKAVKLTPQKRRIDAGDESDFDGEEVEPLAESDLGVQP